jgi:DNA-directed RNA polymerase subunit K/omega
MVNRPANMKAYEFVVLSSLRAQQLLAGCIPHLQGDHRAPTMAQMEVAGGYITHAEVKDAPASQGD